MREAKHLEEHADEVAVSGQLELAGCGQVVGRRDSGEQREEGLVAALDDERGVLGGAAPYVDAAVVEPDVEGAVVEADVDGGPDACRWRRIGEGAERDTDPAGA